MSKDGCGRPVAYGGGGHLGLVERDFAGVAGDADSVGMVGYVGRYALKRLRFPATARHPGAGRFLGRRDARDCI